MGSTPLPSRSGVRVNSCAARSNWSLVTSQSATVSAATARSVGLPLNSRSAMPSLRCISWSSVSASSARMPSVSTISVKSVAACACCARVWAMAPWRSASRACQSAVPNPIASANTTDAAAPSGNAWRCMNLRVRYHRLSGRASTGAPSRWRCTSAANDSTLE